jgi:hypothetical protein
MTKKSKAWLDGYMTARAQGIDVALLHGDEQSEIGIVELLAGMGNISEQWEGATCEADKQKVLVQQEAMEDAACRSRAATFMADNIANAVAQCSRQGQTSGWIRSL